MEKLITVELISKNIEEWEEFSIILKERILEAKGILKEEKKKKLSKKIRKEKKKLDKHFDAPTDVGDKDWFEYLKEPYNWEYIAQKEVDIFYGNRCCEESCRRLIEKQKGEIIIYFYRAKGDDTYFLCEFCYEERKDNEILWAQREVTYYNETEREKEERSYNRKEWYRDESVIKNGDWHDMECKDDDCWYHGNLDRMGEYGEIYVFRGNDRDLILCDVCFMNHRYERQYRYWKYKIDKEDKLKKRIKQK